MADRHWGILRTGVKMTVADKHLDIEGFVQRKAAGRNKMEKKANRWKKVYMVCSAKERALYFYKVGQIICIACER